MILALSGASAAQAGGYAAPEASVRSLGRANAGAAADQGAHALAWNPAGISGSPREAHLGGFGRGSELELADRGSTVSRAGGPQLASGGRSPIEDPTPGFGFVNLALAIPVGDRLTAGLAVTRPFQLRTDFPADAFNRYDTLMSRIEVTQVRAGLAWRASDTLDLGLAIDGQHMDAGLDAAFPNLSPLLPDAVSRVAGDGWDFGWSAGARARLGQATVGFAYASSVRHELEGGISVSGLLAPLDAANFAAPTTLTVNTPWMATLALAWPATPALTLHAQVQRTGWSEYEAIELAFAGQSQAIAQDYGDTTSISLGADYRLSERWTVRGGVGFEPTPTPDYIRESGVPDSDRAVYAGGATATLRPTVKVDFAVSYTDFQGARLSRDIPFYQGTPAASLARLRGEVDGHELTAGAGITFGF